VGEARNLGLIGAVDIVSQPGTNKSFTGKQGGAGWIVHGIRDPIVMVCPPLALPPSG
jgi:putrescine---pyruvate transaminase